MSRYSGRITGRSKASRARTLLLVPINALVYANGVVADWPTIRPEIVSAASLSSVRGENSTQTDQPPLDLHRSTKHLVLELPIGSQEGAYDVALLSETGYQILSDSGVAKLEDHVVNLRADVDLEDVRPGLYYLALQQRGLELRRYLVACP